MSEQSVVERGLRLLEPHFVIHQEVPGRHFSGKQLCLDAVAQPKEVGLWKNKQAALGIEFKDTLRYEQNYDTHNYTKWLAQCVDYSHAEWEGFGYLYIFAYGGLVQRIGGRRDGPEQDRLDWFLPHLMAQLGIGELKVVPDHGLSFLLNGHHRVWSVSKGVEEGKRYNLKRTFGSR
jgi:hypothetical protein